MDKVHIDAFAYEEDGVWIVQGVQMDIVARAASLDEVPRAFSRAVFAHILVARHLKVPPFETLDVAPAEFRERFDNARSRVILPADAADFIPKEVELRLAA